jgi:hypothetical protein
VGEDLEPRSGMAWKEIVAGLDSFRELKWSWVNEGVPGSHMVALVELAVAKQIDWTETESGILGTHPKLSAVLQFGNVGGPSSGGTVVAYSTRVRYTAGRFGQEELHLDYWGL